MISKIITSFILIFIALPFSATAKQLIINVDSYCNLIPGYRVTANILTTSGTYTVIWDLFCTNTECSAIKTTMSKENKEKALKFIGSFSIQPKEYSLNVTSHEATIHLGTGFVINIKHDGSVDIFKPFTGERYTGNCRIIEY
jgi:hypothetical protein